MKIKFRGWLAVLALLIFAIIGYLFSAGILFFIICLLRLCGVVAHFSWIAAFSIYLLILFIYGIRNN